MSRPLPKPRAVRRRERRAARAAGTVSDRRKHGPTRRRDLGRQNRAIPPILWLVLAAAAILAVPIIAYHGYQVVRAQHLLDHRTMCDTSTYEVGPDCLNPIAGRLDGPHGTHRDPGSRWSVETRGETLDSFALPDTATEVVAPLAAHVTVLAREGDVVAVLLPDGTAVTTWDLGWRGATQALLWILLCTGCAGGAIDFGRRRRAATGSWWRVRGRYVNPTSTWVVGILVPTGLVWILFDHLVPWWLCLAALPAAMIAFTVLARRRLGPTHGRTTPVPP